MTATSADHRFAYRLEVPVDRRPSRESLEWDGKKLFWTEEAAEGPSGRGQPPQKFAPGSLVVVLDTPQGKQPQLAQGGVLYLQRFIQQPPVPYASAIAEALTSSLEYHFALDRLPKPSVPQSGITLDAGGANLAAVLDVMQNSPDRSAFAALQKALHEAIPTLRGIVLPPAPQPLGAKTLEFILSGNGQPPVTIPASLASSGALLLTAFLALAYTPTPSLLLFEEPENGLHPYRLQMVLDILRKMSRGELGNRTPDRHHYPQPPLVELCAPRGGAAFLSAIPRRVRKSSR